MGFFLVIFFVLLDCLVFWFDFWDFQFDLIFLFSFEKDGVGGWDGQGSTTSRIIIHWWAPKWNIFLLPWPSFSLLLFLPPLTHKHTSTRPKDGLKNVP